jgi:hypothetical protein
MMQGAWVTVIAFVEAHDAIRKRGLLKVIEGANNLDQGQLRRFHSQRIAPRSPTGRI